MNIGRWSAADVADRLSGSGRQRKQKTGDGWKVCCPAHSDRTPSLSLKDGDKGLVYYCFGGCSQEDVRRALENALGGEPLPDNRGKSKAKKEKVEDTRVAIVPIPDDVHVTIDDFNHSNFGSPSQLWTYRTADGRIASWVARYDAADGSKEVIPWCWMKRPEDKRGKLVPKALPDPRPLYNLDEIVKSDQPVLWNEGEKAADAAAKLFPNWIPTATQGGGNAVRLTDYKPLEDRVLIIAPDNDGPGYHAASEIARIAGGMLTLKMLVWPQRWPRAMDDERAGKPYNMNKGDDLADHLKAGWTHELLKLSVAEGHKLVHRYYLLEDGFETIYYDYEAEKRIQNR